MLCRELDAAFLDADFFDIEDDEYIALASECYEVVIEVGDIFEFVRCERLVAHVEPVGCRIVSDIDLHAMFRRDIDQLRGVAIASADPIHAMFNDEHLRID